jgi:CelD/BcsL family acetyltransferase involved in cellulose biosynthesis
VSTSGPVATSTTPQRLGGAVRAAVRSAPHPTKAGDGHTVEVLSAPPELEELREGWDRLRADFHGPYNHLDMLIAVAYAPPLNYSPQVVVVRQKRRLVGVAPMLRRDGAVGDYRLVNDVAASGFRYVDEAGLTVLVDAMLALRRPLSLRSLLAGSPTDRALEEQPGSSFLRFSQLWEMGPSLEVDDALADPLSRLSASRRKSLRRKERKLEALGELTFSVERVRDDLDEQFDEFVRLEGSGWKVRAGTALCLDERQRERLRRFVGAAAVREDVRFARLCVDGQPIAGELAVVSDGHLWALKGGYDESYRAYSPGLLLELRLMGWAYQAALERYELMGEMEDWKRPFGAGRSLRHVRLYPLSPRGFAGLSRDAVAKAWRDLRE